jgi:hypothetical protein
MTSEENRGRLDMMKDIAASYVAKYGAEKAEGILVAKAMGAMTDEDQNYWFEVASQVGGV